MIRMILPVLVLLCLSTSYSLDSGREHHVKVLSSHFQVACQTNINSFSCELLARGSDSLKVRSFHERKRLDFVGLNLRYRTSDFDCGLEAMSQDLRETLKYDQHPFIEFQVNTIEIRPESDRIERLSVKANVMLSIAGTKRTVQIENGQVLNIDEDELIFKGSRVIRLSDFGIEPPSKMMGLVQVKDELEVCFEIKMKTQPV